MDVEPPSATTRFGIFFLIGGLVLIGVLWGVLKFLDHPAAPARSDKTRLPDPPRAQSSPSTNSPNQASPPGGVPPK